MSLTPKQLRFIEEYLIDFNSSQAAIRAGYAPKYADQQGSRLLTRVEIRALVAEKEENRLARIAGSADWIVERAVEVVNRALNAVPVRDSRGNVIEGMWTCDLKAATPALVLLAKRHLEFSERVEHTGADGGPILVLGRHQVITGQADDGGR